MAHAVSASYQRSDHMPPVAALLAGLLHAGTALALFLVSPLNQHDLADNAITVTFEEPKEEAKPPAPPPPRAAEAAPPPPPPAAAAKPEPKPEPKSEPKPEARSKIPIGISPAAPVSPDPPAQQETAKPTTREAVEPPKPVEPDKPAEKPPEKPVEPQQQAAAAPAPRTPPPPPEPPLEEVVPPVEMPPAPLTMRDFVKVLPPPPAPPPQPQPQHQQSTPPQHQPAPSHPSQALQRSPLSTGAPTPPSTATASVSTFVNPAAVAARNRAFDAYRLQVAGQISRQRVFAANNSEGGEVELMVSIARDGRLLDVRVNRSSGFPRLDSAVLEAAKAASPYAPPPPDVAGSPVSFPLPMGYRKMN